MKVILLESIKKLGSKGDIVEVSDGQAKNFLIPKKMAEEATSKNINVLNQRNKSIERKEDQLLDNAKITEKKINDIIKQSLQNSDLFIISDYGHGLINSNTAKILTTKKKFIALNSYQILLLKRVLPTALPSA